MLSLDLVSAITITDNRNEFDIQRDTENEAVRLMMFPLSLTGEAKTWLDELNKRTIETWDELRIAFISRLEVSSIRRIQVLDTAYWGFLGVGTMLDIFQNIKFAQIRRTLFDVITGRPSGSLPSNSQPNPRGGKAYQPPQARNEHVNVVFTRSSKSYNPPDNPDDQQNKSKNPINFDSEDEDDEPTPQPKTQPIKPVKETSLPKPYKPKISDESSSMIQNKVLAKLRDPRNFLIQCNFNKTFSCNALADLGASINLMPYSLYAKLSLETLKPTKMSVRLADRSFQYPIRIAENMLVEVGKFTFPADFVILKMEEDIKVPLILGRPFLHTVDAVIRVKQKQLNPGIGTE
ncbi:reverse transcriptase domain-containing protein [Tanacetum coccineum]